MNHIIFEESQALVRLLNKANVNQHEIFSKIDFGPRKNQMTKLFELMRDQEFNDTVELKECFYGKSPQNDKKFIKLYNRYQEKLINTLFIIDTNSPLFSDRSRAFIQCSKRCSISRILEDKGMINLALSISERTIEVCQKYEFTELTIEFAKILCRQYSTTFINIRKFNKFEEIYDMAFQLFIKEASLSKITNLIGFHLNSSVNKFTIDINSSSFKNNLSLAMTSINDQPSIELLVNSSSIISFYFQKIRDFESYKKFNNLILEKLLLKKFISVVLIENNVINQLRMALISKDFDTANSIDRLYFSKINIGNFNWYVYCFYYILIMYHCKYYIIGIQYFNNTILNSTFNKQPPVIKENFYIIEAYTHFLIRIGKISVDKEISEFRLNKFLNQVPEYSKDKSGVNIPIILVQILFFLADKKYNKIIDRMESLNLYAYRYLKKDETFRSQCFIRMFSEMTRAGFKKQGTLVRTLKWCEKLKGMPIDTYPETADHEIIPYEDLWDMVIEQLD